MCWRAGITRWAPEHFTALADHYLAGEDCIKGVEYAKRSGRQAEKRNALNDAIAIAKKRILALEKAPKTDEIEKQRVDARVTLGLYYNQMTFPADAKEAIEYGLVSRIVGHKRELGDA